MTTPEFRSPAAPRWGIGDFVIVWVAAVIVAVIALSLVYALLGVDDVAHIARSDEITGTIVTLYTQALAMAGGVALVAAVRGIAGGLRENFGLVIRLRDAPWLLLGIAISLGGSAGIYPLQQLHDKTVEQHVVTIFREASGVQLALFAVAVGLVAPIAEELLFRGLLLRALERRLATPWAVLVAAAVFALGHLIDPSAYIALFPLMLLALVSCVAAVRSFELSKSIFLHIGFNLITVVLVVGKFSNSTS